MLWRSGQQRPSVGHRSPMAQATPALAFPMSDIQESPAYDDDVTLPVQAIPTEGPAQASALVAPEQRGLCRGGLPGQARQGVHR